MARNHRREPLTSCAKIHPAATQDLHYFIGALTPMPYPDDGAVDGAPASGFCVTPTLMLDFVVYTGVNVVLFRLSDEPFDGGGDCGSICESEADRAGPAHAVKQNRKAHVGNVFMKLSATLFICPKNFKCSVAATWTRTNTKNPVCIKATDSARRDYFAAINHCIGS